MEQISNSVFFRNRLALLRNLLFGDLNNTEEEIRDIEKSILSKQDAVKIKISTLEIRLKMNIDSSTSNSSNSNSNVKNNITPIRNSSSFKNKRDNSNITSNRVNDKVNINNKFSKATVNDKNNNKNSNTQSNSNSDNNVTPIITEYQQSLINDISHLKEKLESLKQEQNNLLAKLPSSNSNSRDAKTETNKKQQQKTSKKAPNTTSTGNKSKDNNSNITINKNLNCDGLILILGMSSLNSPAQLKLANWLLFLHSSINNLEQHSLPEKYQDTFLILTKTKLFIFSDKENQIELMRLTSDIFDLEVEFYFPEESSRINDLYQNYKISKFVEYSKHLKRVAICLSSHEHGKNIELEKWPLINSYGIDCLKEGFFTLNKEIVDLTMYLEFVFPIDYEFIDSKCNINSNNNNNGKSDIIPSSITPSISDNYNNYNQQTSSTITTLKTLSYLPIYYRTDLHTILNSITLKVKKQETLLNDMFYILENSSLEKRLSTNEEALNINSELELLIHNYHKLKSSKYNYLSNLPDPSIKVGVNSNYLLSSNPNKPLNTIEYDIKYPSLHFTYENLDVISGLRIGRSFFLSQLQKKVVVLNDEYGVESSNTNNTSNSNNKNKDNESCSNEFLSLDSRSYNDAFILFRLYYILITKTRENEISLLNNFSNPDISSSEYLKIKDKFISELVTTLNDELKHQDRYNDGFKYLIKESNVDLIVEEYHTQLREVIKTTNRYFSDINNNTNNTVNSNTVNQQFLTYPITNTIMIIRIQVKEITSIITNRLIGALLYSDSYLKTASCNNMENNSSTYNIYNYYNLTKDIHPIKFLATSNLHLLQPNTTTNSGNTIVNPNNEYLFFNQIKRTRTLITEQINYVGLGFALNENNLDYLFPNSQDDGLDDCNQLFFSFQGKVMLMNDLLLFADTYYSNFFFTRTDINFIEYIEHEKYLILILSFSNRDCVPLSGVIKNELLLYFEKDYSNKNSVGFFKKKLEDWMNDRSSNNNYSAIGGLNKGVYKKNISSGYSNEDINKINNSSSNSENINTKNSLFRAISNHNKFAYDLCIKALIDNSNKDKNNSNDNNNKDNKDDFNNLSNFLNLNESMGNSNLSEIANDYNITNIIDYVLVSGLKGEEEMSINLGVFKTTHAYYSNLKSFKNLSVYEFLSEYDDSNNDNSENKTNEDISNKPTFPSLCNDIYKTDLNYLRTNYYNDDVLNNKTNTIILIGSKVSSINQYSKLLLEYSQIKGFNSKIINSCNNESQGSINTNSTYYKNTSITESTNFNTTTSSLFNSTTKKKPKKPDLVIFSHQTESFGYQLYLELLTLIDFRYLNITKTAFILDYTYVFKDQSENLYQSLICLKDKELIKYVIYDIGMLSIKEANYITDIIKTINNDVIFFNKKSFLNKNEDLNRLIGNNNRNNINTNNTESNNELCFYNKSFFEYKKNNSIKNCSYGDLNNNYYYFNSSSKIESISINQEYKIEERLLRKYIKEIINKPLFSKIKEFTLQEEKEEKEKYSISANNLSNNDIKSDQKANNTHTPENSSFANSNNHKRDINQEQLDFLLTHITNLTIENNKKEVEPNILFLKGIIKLTNKENNDSNELCSITLNNNELWLSVINKSQISNINSNDNGIVNNLFTFTIIGTNLLKYKERISREIRFFSGKFPEKKRFISINDVTQEEKDNLNIANFSSDIPDDWYTDGPIFVDNNDGRHKYHPFIDKFMKEYVEFTNEMISEHNKKVEEEIKTMEV